MVKTALRRAVGVVNGVNWVAAWILAALLLTMSILIAWQVFARFVVGSPLTFSEEVSRFAMVWMTMLGAGYAYRYGSLISVDILESVVGPTARRVLHVGIALLSMAFAYVLLVEGLSITSRVAGQTAPSTGISMAWLYAAMPAGAGLILVNAVGVLIDQYLPGKES